MKHLLMVHDLVWINTTVTGRTVPYDYASLEAAIAAQYDYGPQGSPEKAAARVLDCLIRTRPFTAGNLRTALAATLALLEANGWALTADDAHLAAALRAIGRGEQDGAGAVSALAEPGGDALRPGVTLRTLVAHVCNAHAEALQALAAGDG